MGEDQRQRQGGKGSNCLSPTGGSTAVEAMCPLEDQFPVGLFFLYTLISRGIWMNGMDGCLLRKRKINKKNDFNGNDQCYGKRRD
jgi:hypothetical protein